MAGERGQSLAQMALSWILKDEDVTSVLIGASDRSRLFRMWRLCRIRSSPGRTEKIDQISRAICKVETCAKKLFAKDAKEILNK